jgi:hypothetical protein
MKGPQVLAVAVAADSDRPIRVVDIALRQHRELRLYLRQWQISLNLPNEYRRVVLEQLRITRRRALGHASRQEDIEARGVLAVIERFISSVREYPEELVFAVRQTLAVEPEILQYREQTREIDNTSADALRGLRRIGKVANLFGYMARIERIFRTSQSARATKARPRKKPTQRGETIRAMRGFRANGHTLDQFLGAAGNDSIDGLSIELREEAGVARYEIDSDNFIGTIVSRRTLEEWWSAAGGTKRGLAG